MTDHSSSPKAQPSQALSAAMALDLFAAQSDQIRALDAKLSLLIELLTPEHRDGPTLEDILARLVTVIQEQRPILSRIDQTTAETLELVQGQQPLTPEHPTQNGHART